MKPLYHTRQDRVFRTILTVAVMGCLWLVPLFVSAQPGWEANKGNCEDILVHPENYDLDDVRRCAQIWEAYRDVTTLDRSEAMDVARGFSRLFYEGTAADRSMAQTALDRISVAVLERGDFLPSGATSTSAYRNRPLIPVGESSSRAQRRAQGYNRDGMREYERGDYREAAREFERALEADPWYARAKYNLACQLTLLGDHDEAIEHLDELSRWDSNDAREQISHALADEDFIPLRDDPRFRAITGYTRVQLLNGAGQEGLARTQEIYDALSGSHMDVDSYGYDRHHRFRPHIWYRPGYEQKAQQVEDLLESEATGVRMIDWDTQYDLIISWGQSGETGSSVPPPIVQGTFDGTILETGAEESLEEAEEAVEEVRGFVDDWVPSD